MRFCLITELKWADEYVGELPYRYCAEMARYWVANPTERMIQNALYGKRRKVSSQASDSDQQPMIPTELIAMASQLPVRKLSSFHPAIQERLKADVVARST